MITKKFLIIVSVFIFIICINLFAKYTVDNYQEYCPTYEPKINGFYRTNNITVCFIGKIEYLKFLDEIKKNESKNNWLNKINYSLSSGGFMGSSSNSSSFVSS